jgi:hypothetical protein
MFPYAFPVFHLCWCQNTVKYVGPAAVLFPLKAVCPFAGLPSTSPAFHLRWTDSRTPVASTLSLWGRREQVTSQLMTFKTTNNRILNRFSFVCNIDCRVWAALFLKIFAKFRQTLQLLSSGFMSWMYNKCSVCRYVRTISVNYAAKLRNTDSHFN